jgi:hypothetical protein
MNLKIKTDFAFAHRGVELKTYTAGEVVETDDAQLIEIAIAEGWAVDADQPESKAKKGAPENKSVG